MRDEHWSLLAMFIGAVAGLTIAGVIIQSHSPLWSDVAIGSAIVLAVGGAAGFGLVQGSHLLYRMMDNDN